MHKLMASRITLRRLGVEGLRRMKYAKHISFSLAITNRTGTSFKLAMFQLKNASVFRIAQTLRFCSAITEFFIDRFKFSFLLFPSF